MKMKIKSPKKEKDISSHMMDGRSRRRRRDKEEGTGQEMKCVMIFIDI